MAICFSGLAVLALLAGRDRTARPLLPAGSARFPPIEAGSLALVALGVFLAYSAVQWVVLEMGAHPALGAGGILAALGMAFGVYRLVVRRAMESRGSRPARLGQGLVVFWAGMPLVYGALAVLASLGYETPQAPVRIIEKRGAGWQATAVFAVLVAPVMEELLFRGLLYPALRRLRNARWATVASAVLFGLVHFDSPAAVAPMTIFGVLLAYLVEKTGSLLPCVAAHLAFNALSVGQLVFA